MCMHCCLHKLGVTRGINTLRFVVFVCSTIRIRVNPELYRVNPGLTLTLVLFVSKRYKYRDNCTCSWYDILTRLRKMARTRISATGGPAAPPSPIERPEVAKKQRSETRGKL